MANEDGQTGQWRLPKGVVLDAITKGIIYGLLPLLCWLYSGVNERIKENATHFDACHSQFESVNTSLLRLTDEVTRLNRDQDEMRQQIDRLRFNNGGIEPRNRALKE